MGGARGNFDLVYARQGDWLAGSWDGRGLEEEVKGLARVAVVDLEVVGQGFAFLEGDEGQQDVAGQRQIERGVGFEMAVSVFLPGAG